MTAFGRAEERSPIGSVSIEIQSLNRKFLDLSIYMPKELSLFDAEVRKQVSSIMNRGKVSIKINVEYQDNSPISVSSNLPLARQIHAAWKELSDDLKIDGALDINVIAQMPEVIQYQVKLNDESSWKELLFEALKKALENALEMKTLEGKAIHNDFSERLDSLSGWINKIEKYLPDVKERHKEKLTAALNAVMESGNEFEERLLKELCLFAEKVDITEEITRLLSHIEQFRVKMSHTTGPIGKTLEFLLQEMQREVNTIGSKAQDLNISKLVVEMKGELERIREQVQNVE